MTLDIRFDYFKSLNLTDIMLIFQRIKYINKKFKFMKRSGENFVSIIIFIDINNCWGYGF